MKAKIIRIGRVVVEDGKPHLSDWIFDCLNMTDKFHVVLPDGTEMLCGYSMDSLKRIAMPYFLTRSEDGICRN